MFRQKIPARIGRLDELANNLWWSWHDRARVLFQALDYRLWHSAGHNPVKQLHDINPDKLRAAASDPAFLNLYDSVMSAFDADMSGDTWSGTRYGLLPGPLAYFSAEFALHNCLPIYAGGLGILAGDLCKEASDSGLPMVGVGFTYPEGYFEQRISSEGWQQELFRQLKFDEAPIRPWPLPQESGPSLQVQVGDRSLHLGAWRVCLGRVNLCLLDTNVAGNSPQDRQLSARLYAADQEHRIQQEIILGIGGVRMLRALGIKPAVWHANEGHTAFMMLERVREEIERGAPFPEALRTVRATTVFTTHTPVPAGSDIFPVELVEKYFRHYWESLAIDGKTFLGLGQQGGSDERTFNMTVLGLKMAAHCNGVSQLHGGVARRMWHGLWPGVEEDKVPIPHVTNGVHVPSWVAPELYELYRKYLGPVWIKRHFDPEILQYIVDIPDDELWEVRQNLRRKLIHTILERAQQRWARGEVTADQVPAIGALLDVDVLTIAFVRRFVEYKRPALIFQDIERLKRIINDPWRPVQIIFAGKSHPADSASKCLLQQVYCLAKNREFQGRIAFVEDYEMHLAHYLVQGADVWLNTPRRLQEACGTSGMKAAINGALHLSVRDGWWGEGYNGANGWAIGDTLGMTPGEEDKADAEAIYHLLEKEIVPLFYDRDTRDVPHGWIGMVKESIRSVMPVFCARRMLKEYIERMYMPAIQSLK